MTFYEQELRKIIGEQYPDATYVGRTCYVQLGDMNRAKIQFVAGIVANQYNALLLSGKLWTYLADLNEQAADRLACIVSQMQEAEGVTEELKARDQLAWVGGMNSIRSRAEEIILSEMIFV